MEPYGHVIIFDVPAYSLRVQVPVIIYLPKTRTMITITLNQVPNYWVLGPSGIVAQ